jgi:hypothetical protein
MNLLIYSDNKNKANNVITISANTIGLFLTVTYCKIGVLPEIYPLGIAGIKYTMIIIAKPSDKALIILQIVSILRTL